MNNYKIYLLYLILIIYTIIALNKEKIIVYYYLNNIIYIKYKKSYKINNGPYVLKNGINIYEYNPSILKSDKGDIIYTSRLSCKSKSKSIIESNKCKNILKINKNNNVNNVNIDIIENNYKLIPKNIIENLSNVILKYDNKTIILPIDKININKLNLNNCNISLGYEDPRLFKFNNKIWIYFHYIGRDNLNNTDKLSRYITISSIDNIDNFIYLHTDDMIKIEKNWMPFEYNNELYFEYSIEPHIILKAQIDINKNPLGYCDKIYKTENNKIYKNNNNKNKIELGGGSPSVRIKLNGNFYYLGLCHTRGIIKKITTRKNLFYIFRGEPPFDIIYFGKEIHLCNNINNIEFATGLIVENYNNSDKIDDYKVIVSYGIDDCCGYINEYKLNDIIDINDIKI